MAENRTTELLPFQLDRVSHTHRAILQYDPSKNLFTGHSTLTQLKRGAPKPYLHRIRAVTGAGKTPILAALAERLKDGIILWTTPRTAVISQTLENLNGKYRNLLPETTAICDLSEISQAEWEQTLAKESGLTILVATVASFNQDKTKLKLFQGTPSRWDELKAHTDGGKRQRRIYVFYDEGHSATERQFAKLLELSPYAFVLASASELSEDLYPLLPGEDREEKQRIYNEERTTVVPTAEVVKAGLLKRRVEIYDLDESWPAILAKANSRWEYITKVSPQPPIICLIVDSTDEGITVWHELRRLGVPGEKIAVHLNRATKRAKDLNSGVIPKGFRDTYTAELGPKEIRDENFTHLIWNLSLQEGWDEPWAYVGYVHNIQYSATKIEQRVGRLIRNPFRTIDGLPTAPDDPDLDTAFFYLNCDNQVFADFLEEFKRDLNTSDIEILRFKSQNNDEAPRLVDPKIKKSCPRLFLRADVQQITRDFLKSLIPPADVARHAPGVERRVQIDLDTLNQTDEQTTLAQSFELTCGEVIRNFLLEKDWRLIKAKLSTGAWLHPSIWQDAKLKFSVCFGSEAHRSIERKCDEFCEAIDQYLRLITESGEDYTVLPFKLNNPNGGTSEQKRAYYKVHKFNHAVHPEYNGFNKPELAVAKCLDGLGLTWARNPPKVGYGIPLFRISGASTEFYPDFLVWKKDAVCCIEPKGRQLVEEAISTRLVRLPEKISLFMLTEAGIVVNKQTGKIESNTEDAFTVLYRNHHLHFKSEHFQAVNDAIKFCLNSAFG